ncbi:hypothetical protein EV426DRAFT_448661 [Tirmania nivea]|nr:hypothetical protein EV426DRAFT_448661 [Tirmania nivea]
MPPSNNSHTPSRIPPGTGGSSSETTSTPQKRPLRMVSSGHISTRSDASSYIMTRSGSVDPNLFSTPVRPTSSAGMSSASSSAYSRADTPDYHGYGRPDSISPVSAAASSPGAAAAGDWGDGTIKSRKEGAAAMQRSGSKRSIKPRYGSTYTSPYAQSELAKIVMTPEGNIPIEQYIAYKPQFDENGNLIPFTIPQPPPPPPLKPDPKRENMGRKALSFDGFSRLRGGDKDKGKSKDRSGGHDDHGEVPVTPPATALSHSSSSTKNSSNLGQSTGPSTPASSIGGNQATKGTVPVSLQTPPGMIEFERKHSKSKNSSLTDLGQSLLGRFSSGHHSSSPGSTHSNDRDVSPTAEKESKKLKKLREKEKEKEKEKDKDASGGPDRKPSKRDRIRKIFGRRSGSDGGSGLQSTISAEDLTHGEYLLPSNSSIGSMEPRDIDLRSRPSAESLASNFDVSPKPKMVAREERLSLTGGRSREELRHMRSTSTGSFWPARNIVDLDEVDSDEEVGKKGNEKKEAEVEEKKEVVEEPKQKEPEQEEPKHQDKQVQAATLPAPVVPISTPASAPPAPLAIPTSAPPEPISIPTFVPLEPLSLPTSTPQASAPSPAAMEIGSPKRKGPRIMGSMESMIPIPNKSIRRVGSMSMGSLGSIISANSSTTSVNTTASTPSTPSKDKSRSQSISTPIKNRSFSTSTSKDRSQPPATSSVSNFATSTSPTKRPLPRPVANLTPSKLLNQSPGANSAKSKAMKYGSLIDDANATIRPRISKARKPSAALVEMVGDDEVIGGRARSNSLPSGKRSGYNSESGEESSTEEMKRRSVSAMVVDKGKQKEVVKMEPLGEVNMPMTEENVEKVTELPVAVVEDKPAEMVEPVEEKVLGKVEEMREEKVEERLEEKVTAPPVVVRKEKPVEIVKKMEAAPLPAPEVSLVLLTPEEALPKEQEKVVEEPAAEQVVAPRVEEPECEMIHHPTQTNPPSENKEEEKQKALEPEVEKMHIEAKPTGDEITDPMSPTPLSPMVLPMSPINSPTSPIQPTKDFPFPTLNKKPSSPLQGTEDSHTIKKKPSLTLQDDFPTLNRKSSLVKQEIDKWEKMMMQETTSSSSKDEGKRRSFESIASSGWTTDEDAAPVFSEKRKDTLVGVEKGIAAMTEEEKAQQEKVDRVAKEVHMLIDETEKEVRKHVGKVTSLLRDEERPGEELDEAEAAEDEEEYEEVSAPTTIVPATPDEIPTSPRVVPLPVSLPASLRSIPTSPRSIPTSPKHMARDMPIDSLDQILGSPKTLPLSPKNIPTSQGSTWGIQVGSLNRLLGSPPTLPTSPKTTPIPLNIIPAREVPVESLDKVLEEMETGSLESYLSPRLVPPPSADEPKEESEEELEAEERKGLRKTRWKILKKKTRRRS